MKSRAIYTSIVGNIDALVQPRATDPRYDYICFVRKGTAGTGSNGIWQLKEIPADIKDDRMLSRYPKLHPDEVLPGYEWSLWMDGNLSVGDSSFYRLIDKQIDAGVQMSVPIHPFRDCIYEEAYAAVGADKETYCGARRTIAFLQREGYPRHAGLFENSILLRHYGEEAIGRLNKRWWECLQTISGRDQLSFVYCAWKEGVKIVPLLPEGISMRNCPGLDYVSHQPKEQTGLMRDLCKRIAQFLLRQQINCIDRKQCRK